MKLIYMSFLFITLSCGDPESDLQKADNQTSEDNDTSEDGERSETFLISELRSEINSTESPVVTFLSKPSMLATLLDLQLNNKYQSTTPDDRSNIPGDEVLYLYQVLILG